MAEQKAANASDVAVSSRVRLARNIKNFPFPGRMDQDQGLKVIDMVRDSVFKSSDAMAENLVFFDIQKLNPVDRQVLVEKHLISPDLADGSLKRAAIISRDERISIMINEEDHVRMQCIFPGMQLDDAWQLCNRLDLLMEEELEFAFDTSSGYLTCCPTNLGTGIRASVMVHLPALSMTGYISGVLEACGKLGMAVRGIYGEKSETLGNMFQISNQVTLGRTEEEIIASINNVTHQIIEQERTLRNELNRQSASRFEDRIYRSLGILANARIISTEESLRLLSDVRLGVDMKFIEGINAETLNEIMLFIQPAILQKLAGKQLAPDERDIRRAELIRKSLVLCRP
jgi:protein arginine kinase